MSCIYSNWQFIAQKKETVFNQEYNESEEITASKEIMKIQ
jgi:hypothetical protein